MVIWDATEDGTSSRDRSLGRGRKFFFSSCLFARARGVFLQFIQVLLDREEDANNVCRLDQLENRDDGLRADVEVDAVFSSFVRLCLA